KTLRAAIETSGYRAVNAVLIYVDGARDDSDLMRRVAQQCANLADAGLRDGGVYQRGRTFWFLFPEPYRVPTLDAAVIGPHLLDLVNRARAQPRRCGNDEFRAAPPLRWSQVLQRVASAHAREMAERGT